MRKNTKGHIRVLLADNGMGKVLIGNTENGIGILLRAQQQ